MKMTVIRIQIQNLDKQLSLYGVTVRFTSLARLVACFGGQVPTRSGFKEVEDISKKQIQFCHTSRCLYPRGSVCQQQGVSPGSHQHISQNLGLLTLVVGHLSYYRLPSRAYQEGAGSQAEMQHSDVRCRPCQWWLPFMDHTCPSLLILILTCFFPH